MRIGENVGRAVAEDEPGADDEAEVAGALLVLAQEHMRAHDSGERIAVGDAEAGKAERDRLRDQFLRMRGAAQEGEIGGDGEFRIGGHASLPLLVTQTDHAHTSAGAPSRRRRDLRGTARNAGPQRPRRGNNRG